MSQLDPRIATAIRAERDARLAAEREAEASAAAEAQEASRLSTAINVRRIALVLILGVVLTVGSSLVGLSISVMSPDLSTAKTILTVWLAVAALIMIMGLYIIVYGKRLTKF